MQDKSKENPTNFSPESQLGFLFEKAKLHNRYNALLKSRLPIELSGLSLCLVEGKKVFLAAKNPSVAFRAKKQKTKLLSIIKKIEGLNETKSLSIKVDEKNTG
ncbi:hypothetical protein CL646_02965 [bacterium]|nr:hypothetical protein [bacterium]|tara:strand:- start:52 stop:360 length:309 start_codon:yes stop_codon:yes gene_type:complete